jgi:hypothetical protein
MPDGDPDGDEVHLAGRVGVVAGLSAIDEPGAAAIAAAITQKEGGG